MKTRMNYPMKNRILSFPIALALASIVTPSLNADDSKPDINKGRIEIEILPGFQVGPIVKRAGVEPRIFLGVGLAELPEIVREQLGVPPGMGLAISHVMKDSPAAKAGVKAHDVLLKLDDHQLVNPEQLQTLLGNKKEGDATSLTLITRGKEHKVAVKLEMGKGDVFGNRNPLLGQPNIWRFQGGQLNPQNGPFDGLRIDPNELLKRFQFAPNFEIQPELQPDGQGFRFNAQTQHNSMSAMSDESGKYTYTNRNGKKHFKAENLQGKTVFDGEVNTDEQRKGIPDEIRAKLEKMEKSVKINPQPFERKIEPKKKPPTNDERA